MKSRISEGDITVLKRAITYILRKKSKSIILICVLCVIIVFMILGLVIFVQASEQVDNFKSTLGNSFSIEIEIDNTDKSLTELIWNDEGEMVGIKRINPVTIDDEFVRTVAAVDDISGYNAQTFNVAHVDFKLKEGQAVRLAADMEKYPPEMKEDLNTEDDIKSMRIVSQTATVFGNAWSHMHTFFLNGALTLS